MKTRKKTGPLARHQAAAREARLAAQAARAARTAQEAALSRLHEAAVEATAALVAAPAGGDREEILLATKQAFLARNAHLQFLADT